MSEEIFISEREFLQKLDSMGYTEQAPLDKEQVLDWYSQFVCQHRENMSPELMELSRGLLSKKEKTLGFATDFASGLIITGYGLGATQLPPELHAKIGKMFLPYFSATSITASAVIMGLSTVTGEALATLADLKGKSKLAKGLRLSMPALGAITAAIYQYVAEFNLPGTFDVNDIVFGVLAVGTGYIGARVISNEIPSAVLNIHLNKEVNNFLEEKLSIEDVVIEPASIDH